MSDASSSVSLVFESREALRQFLAVINGAKIRADEQTWRQWQTVEVGPDAVKLYEFGVVEGVDVQVSAEGVDYI